MTPPANRYPDIDATSTPSASSNVDETAPAGASVVGTAVTGFGPPAAAGEVGTLGPYRVVKELGKGGMGAVYAAVDTRLDRRLALKVMLPQFAADPASRERFLREARAAARVKHDHVVTVYEADERNGVPYIAMEFLEGYPLDEYLKRKGNPTPAQALRLAAEAAAGLAAAHRQGLVHRDVKPGNLWLEAPGGRVKVLDFGLARPVDAEVELTKSGAVVGTPAYMSPEQARGEKVDHRTDLFSLGAVLYRLVTGRLPFEAPNTMAMLIALGTEEPPPVRSLNPAVPGPLAELIHQLLAKAPAARPASADEVVKRLRGMMAARPAPAAPAASQVVYVPIQVTAVPEANPFADLDATEAEPVPAAAPAKPRRPWAVAAGFAALALVALGGVIIIIRNRDGSETKIEVPDGASVTVKGKDGKTLATVSPKAAPPIADDSPDRKAAEWVLAARGQVQVVGRDRNITTLDDLPKDRFTLSSVALTGTNVTDEVLVTLKGCNGLTGLFLSGPNLTDAGLVALTGLPNLARLGLDGSPVTDTGLAHLKDCVNLYHLRLYGTRVTGVGFNQLKGLTRLKELNLQVTPTTDAGLIDITAFQELEVLYLDHTKVTDAGLGQFRTLKKLRDLTLTDTGVTDNGLTHLRGCTGLTHLDVRRTKVTAKGLADFHTAVPGCRIEHDGGVIEAVDVDRKAAEWVISAGGKVQVNGQDRDLAAQDQLPKERFRLSVVQLAGTKVADADLAHLRDCARLEVLRLDSTAVTDAGLAHLKGCRGLVTVSLGSTAVTGAGLDHLRGCPDLKHVFLSHAAVTDAGLAAAKGLPGLGALHLFDTRVTDAGLAHLAGCKELAELHLGATAVTDAGLGALRESGKLKVLDLSRTKASDDGLARLGDLGRFEFLHLAGTGVTDAGLARLKGSPRLAVLHLAGTGVTDAGVANLAGCPQLFHLDLSGTKVTDVGLATLRGVKSLGHLTVGKTAVTAKGLADFHAAVPGCKIEHDGGVIEAVDVDRRAAEWVITVGGAVRVHQLGVYRDAKAKADLPADRFEVSNVYLSKNKAVTDAGMAAFAGCRFIRSLDLDYTPVTDAGLAPLAGVTSVHGLVLHGTAVTDAGLAHFKGCRELQYLNVGDTKVTDVGLAHFKDFPELNSLVFDGTGVTDGGFAHFRGCNKLHNLSLGRTRVTDAGLAQLAGYPALKTLYVMDLPVTDAWLPHLKGLKTLEYLDLGKTKVTDAGLAHLRNLPALRTLHLAYTTVGDGGAEHLAACKGLTTLGLAATGLTDAGLARLHGLRGLTSLSLEQTKVTARGLADFHAAVPGCRIEHDGGVIEPRKE